MVVRQSADGEVGLSTIHERPKDVERVVIEESILVAHKVHGVSVVDCECCARFVVDVHDVDMRVFGHVVWSTFDNVHVGIQT